MEDEAVASVDVAATDDAPSVEVFSNSKEETPRGSESPEAKPSSSLSGSYTPQGTRLASASPYTSRVRDTESPQVEDMQRLLTFQARQIVELERQLAQQRLQIRILNWRTSGYTVRSFKGEVNHAGQVFALKLNEKGDEVASGSQDKTILVWSVKGGRCLRRLRGHAAGVYSLDAQGDMLASGSADKVILTWKFSTGESLLAFKGHKGTVYAVKLAGHLLVSGSADRTVKVWDVRTGEVLNSLEGHTGSISSLAIIRSASSSSSSSSSSSPLSPIIASASFDKTIKLWNLYTGECVGTLEGHTDFVTCLRAVGDRTLVSSSNDKTIKVWDLERQECVRTLTGHADWVNAIAIEPNGHVVVSLSKDRSIKVWHLPTGELLRELKGHQSSIQCLELLPNGVLSASDDAAIKLWTMLFC
jgi:WD40 repeat protein